MLWMQCTPRAASSSMSCGVSHSVCAASRRGERTPSSSRYSTGVVLARQLAGPEDHLLADRIDGVEGEPVDVPGVARVQEGLAFGDALLLLALSFLAAALVHHVVARGNAQAHLPGGLDGGIEEPVLVVEGGRAGADHLQAGDLGRPIDEIVVQVLLYGPDFLEPVEEEHVLADPPHQGHRRVGMHVDESGDGDLAGAVHHLDVSGKLPARGIPGGADPPDPALPDQDVLAGITEGNVPEEDGSHQSSSKSASPKPSAVRCGISPWKQVSRM